MKSADNLQLELFSENEEGQAEIVEQVKQDKEDKGASKQIRPHTDCCITYNLAPLFKRLSKSTFRSSFHLSQKDKDYVVQKGMEVIRQHAADFVAKRLAPACIPNDGKQTPMRGHPVFRAQHATACCCRGCFCKWHHIPAGRALTANEQQYAVSVLMTWIQKEMQV